MRKLSQWLITACALATAIGYFAFRQLAVPSLPEAPATIRIGYAVEAPYAFLDKQNSVIGESPDIAKKVVKCMGVPHIDWRLTDFSRLESELNDGTIDVIASGMFVTPERMQSVSFSYVTFRVSESMLVRAGNPKKLQNLRDFAENPTLKVAVIYRSIEEQLLRKLNTPSAQIVLVPDALTGKSALESGEVDAVILSTPSIRWMHMHQSQQLTEVIKPADDYNYPHGQGAFAFRKQDKALLKAWNKCLKPFIGSDAHKLLVKPYGFDDSQIPNRAANFKPL